MKDFAITFLIILIVLVVFFLFGGALIFDHFWLMLILASLLLALFVYSLVKLSDKIEQLEKRIEILESQKKDA